MSYSNSRSTVGQPCDSVAGAIGRRTLLTAAASVPLLGSASAFGLESRVTPSPLLNRIKIGTIAAQDLSRTEMLFTRWLGYEVRSRGKMDAALATAWGAPRMAGRPVAMLSSPGDRDVYVRIVQTEGVSGYKALTTFGWNSIEIIVDDVAKLNTRLADSPFTILDTPKPLIRFPSIKAMQVKGPSEEVLYLTMESGDRANSLLPYPRAFVGRPFIAVLAGPDSEAMMDWYGSHFAMIRGKVSKSPTRILQTAQGLGPDALFPTGIMELAQHGNLIEFDGYPATAGPRPRAPGQLPPGIAMHSFAVTDLDALKLPFISQPARYPGLGYDGHRAATLIGPAGELIELIEE